jgi:carbon monoxide dehydrogenase subunit G
MAAYSFVTHWRFQAPLEQVWDALNTPERYPEWWPSILEYRKLTPELTGVGARAERVVKGRLPYTLRYRTTITRHETLREIAYDAEGDLKGHGRFVFSQEGATTLVTFYWDVETTGVAMNVLAPLLKWLFAWNHNWVMAQGERGLAEWLAKQQDGK